MWQGPKLLDMDGWKHKGVIAYNKRCQACQNARVADEWGH